MSANNSSNNSNNGSNNSDTATKADNVTKEGAEAADTAESTTATDTTTPKVTLQPSPSTEQLSKTLLEKYKVWAHARAHARALVPVTCHCQYWARTVSTHTRMRAHMVFDNQIHTHTHNTSIQVPVFVPHTHTRNDRSQLLMWCKHKTFFGKLSEEDVFTVLNKQVCACVVVLLLRLLPLLRSPSSPLSHLPLPPVTTLAAIAFVSSEHAKKGIKRFRVWHEVIDSERSYLESLLTAIAVSI